MLVTVSSGTSGAHSGDGSSLIVLHGTGAVLQSDDPVPGIGLEGEFDWPAAQALHSVSASPSQGVMGIATGIAAAEKSVFQVKFLNCVFPDQRIF